MDKDFEIAKQEIVELAETYCEGFVKDYKHGLDKIRALISSYNYPVSFSEKCISSMKIPLYSNKKPSIKEENFEDLQTEIKKCKKVILLQNEKISAIPQLEYDLKESEKKLAVELAKITNKFSNEAAQCNKEMKQHHKILARNSQLEEKIKVMTMEIESYRRQYHKEIDSDGRVSQLQELAATRSKEIQKLEIACNRLRVKLDLKSKDIEKLNKKVSALEQQVIESKNVRKAFEKNDVVDTNGLMVTHYKKKLEEKDQEIKKLNRRVNKMYKVENQCKIKEEGFENERKEYIDRIAKLCKNNSSLEKIIAANPQKYPVLKEEPKTRDGLTHANYENIAELARSATEAYNFVISKEKLSKSTRPTTAGTESWSTRLSSTYKLHF